MSSWYVFSAIGLYPEIPGVAGLAIGTPLFPAITIHLGNGHLLQINAPGGSDTTRYIQSLSIQGQPYTSAWLPFASIANGATMQFTLASQPHPAWGK
jgi:putative alpha-1,2-mannosidase